MLHVQQHLQLHSQEQPKRQSQLHLRANAKKYIRDNFRYHHSISTFFNLMESRSQKSEASLRINCPNLLGQWLYSLAVLRKILPVVRSKITAERNTALS